MKKFRTILCLVLAISMVLVFCACGKTEDTAKDDAGNDTAATDTTPANDTTDAEPAADEEPAAEVDLSDIPEDQRPDAEISSTALHMFSNVEDYLNRPHEIEAGSSIQLIATNDIPSYVPWNATAEAWFMPNVYEGLVWCYMGTSSDIRPLIAESYDHNEDYTEWTFKIREGIKFTDGNVCDANAVAKAWDFYNEASPASFTNINITSWEATGDYEFVVHMNSACAYFLPSVSLLYVLSPAALEQYGINDNRSAVSTAPYMVTGYTAGVGFELTANPDYYYYDRMPVIEKVNFSIINDETTKLMAMINGDVDGYSFTAIESFYNLQDRDFDGTLMISNGNANPNFLNAKSVPEFCTFEVRKAINRFIDLDAVNGLMYDGMGLVQSSIWTVGSSGEVPYDGFYYDEAEGLDLMAQAGIDPNSVKFTAKIIDSSGDLFVTYQGQLAKVGITMEVQPLEPEANFTFLMNGDWTITAGNSGYSDARPYLAWTYILKPEHLIRECWQDLYDPDLYAAMCDEFDQMVASSTWDEMIEHANALTTYEQEDFAGQPGIQAPFFAAYNTNVKDIVYVTENHTLLLYYLYLAD